MARCKLPASGRSFRTRAARPRAPRVAWRAVAEGGCHGRGAREQGRPDHGCGGGHRQGRRPPLSRRRGAGLCRRPARRPAGRRGRRARHGPRRHDLPHRGRRHRGARLRAHGGGDGRRGRPSRRARQLRRTLGRGPERHHDRSRLGPCRLGQPQGHLLLLPLRHPRAAQDAGLHRQPLIGRRRGRHARDGDLHGLQGRREPAHQVTRARARPRPRARQRRLPRRRHVAHAALPGRHVRPAATPTATSNGCWAATRRASGHGSSGPTRWPSSSATWRARRRRPSPAPWCRSTSERARATATPDRP